MVAEVGRRLSHFEKNGLRCSFVSFGYQFYTTSTTPRVFEQTYPTGSIIYIKEPNNPSNPNYVDEELVIRPLASFVENAGDSNAWQYIEPSNNFVTNNENMSFAFKAKNVWQVNGIPEHVYYETFLDETTDSLKIKKQIIGPWVQKEGDISFFNSHNIKDMFYEQKMFHDVKYDIPVGVVKVGYVDQTIPEDADWPDRGCVTTIHDETYGDRSFFILNTADGSWWCWPINVEKDPSLSAVENLTPDLIEQAYKADIPKESAIKIKPAYPNWCNVKNNPVFKDAYGTKEINFPRYSWSFNSKGTKAISVMIERNPVIQSFYSAKYGFDTYSDYINKYIPSIFPMELWYEDLEKTVYYEERTWVFQDGVWRQDAPIVNALFTNVIRPFTKTTPIDPPITKLEYVVDLKTSVNDDKNVYEDRFGFVELGFDVQITGPNILDFSFTINILTEKNPDILNSLNQGMLTQIKYAMPVDWNKTKTIGNPFNQPLDIKTDTVLSCWVKLYQHINEQQIEAAFDGAPSLLTISRSVANFYKGLDFDNKILTLPMNQYIGDFNNGLKGFDSSLFMDEFSYDQNVFYFDAKFKCMDLSSFSFYYEVRLLNQTKSNDTPINFSFMPIQITNNFPNTFEKHLIQNEGGKKLYVCVLGRIAETSYVGSDNPLFQTKIDEWVTQSNFEDSLNNEVFLTLNKKTNFRGFTPASFPYPMPILCTYDEHLDSILNYSPMSLGYLQYNGSGPRSFLNPIIFTTRSKGGASPSVVASGSMSHNTPTQPWWLLGPCAELFFEAIQLSIFRMKFGNLPTTKEHFATLAGIEQYLFVPPGLPGTAPFFKKTPTVPNPYGGAPFDAMKKAYYFSTDFEQPMFFSAINENTIAAFLTYVFNLYDNFKLVNDYILGNWEEGYDWKSNLSDVADITIPVFNWRYTKHPYLALFPDFDLASWIESVKWYALKLIKNMQELYKEQPYYDLKIKEKYSSTLNIYFESTINLTIDPHTRYINVGNFNWSNILLELESKNLPIWQHTEWNDIKYPTPRPVLFNEPLGCSAAVNSMGILQRSQYLSDDLRAYNLQDKSTFLAESTNSWPGPYKFERLRTYNWPNYNIGQNTYNNFYFACFSGDVIDGKSKIVVTATGHYSYSYRGLYWFKKAINAYEICYMSAGNKKLPIFFTSQPGVLNLTNADIEHKLVEKITFYFGQKAITHLEAYNKAFNHNYTNEDFRLDFSLYLSGGTVGFKPYFNDEGLINLNELLCPYFTHMPNQTGSFQLNRSQELTSFVINTHGKERQLRLSPLFICKS